MPTVSQVPGTEYPQIATWLGDMPETVIPWAVLRSEACLVLQATDEDRPELPLAVAIQADAFPQEPVLFGDDAAMAELVPYLGDWSCLNVPERDSSRIETAVRDAAEVAAVHWVDDVYHVGTLSNASPTPIANAQVRVLGESDRPLVEQAPRELLGGESGMAVIEQRLADRLVTGVIRNGLLVGIAHVFAQSERYADIGVVTHSGWRRQGFATAMSAALMQRIAETGREPVWSCAAHNDASIATARRLGLREFARRAYIIPAFDRG